MGNSVPRIVEAWLKYPTFAVTQVRMLQNNPEFCSAAVLYVEGTLDREFFSRAFPQPSRRRIIPAGSKDTLIEAALSANNAAPGILFITDADDEHLVPESRRPEWPDAPRFKTDQRDMETFLLGSAADLVWPADPLRAVVRNLGLEREFSAFESAHGVAIGRALARTAAPLGAMLCAKAQLGLTHPVLAYDKLCYDRLITDVDALDCDALEFTHRVVAELGCSGKTADELYAAMRPFLSRAADEPWRLCRGHDVCALLALKATRIDSQGRIITRQRIEHELGVFRYDPSYLAGTYLYEQLCEWQTSNPSFELLSAEPPENEGASAAG